jgi:hypothetical protein
VYNLWGDYTERSLFTNNTPINGNQPPTSRAELYVGPDGRRDGVIIVVDSGVDIQAPKTADAAGAST